MNIQGNRMIRWWSKINESFTFKFLNVNFFEILTNSGISVKSFVRIDEKVWRSATDFMLFYGMNDTEYRQNDISMNAWISPTTF